VFTTRGTYLWSFVFNSVYDNDYIFIYELKITDVLANRVKPMTIILNWIILCWAHEGVRAKMGWIV
jgi:hypothetical protein